MLDLNEQKIKCKIEDSEQDRLYTEYDPVRLIGS
jgi:hypothetical protein